MNVRSMAQALIWSGSASGAIVPLEERRFGANRRFHQSVIGDEPPKSVARFGSILLDDETVLGSHEFLVLIMMGTCAWFRDAMTMQEAELESVLLRERDTL